MSHHLQANSDWARENRYDFHAESGGPFAQVASGMDVFRRAVAYRGHVIGQHRGRPFEVFDFKKEKTGTNSWSTWHTVVLLPLGDLALPNFALWPRRETGGMNFLGVKGLDLTLPPAASLFDRTLLDAFNRNYSLFAGGAFGTVQAAIEAPGQPLPGLAEMSAVCKPGVLGFLSAAVTGAIEVRDGYLVVCAPETRLVRPAYADVILQGAERERLLTVANDLLDVLADASQEAPLRDLVIGSSFNPKKLLGAVFGAFVGFILSSFLSVILLFLIPDKKSFLSFLFDENYAFYGLSGVLFLLVLGGCLLGSFIGKRLVR
jgi:hypothetical protein